MDKITYYRRAVKRQKIIINDLKKIEKLYYKEMKYWTFTDMFVIIKDFLKIKIYKIKKYAKHYRR
jgi:hypothetical protein